MNRATKVLLNIMRIEVLLGIGLVLWVFSIEAKSQELVELSNGEVADAITLNNNFQSLKAEITKASSRMNIYSEGQLLGELIPELSPYTDGYGYVVKTVNNYLLPLRIRFDIADETSWNGAHSVMFSELDCKGDAFTQLPSNLPKSNSYLGIIGHDKLLGWYSASFTDMATDIVTQSYSTSRCREFSTDYTSERLLRVMSNSEETTGINLPVGEDDTLENIELKYE